MSIHKAAVELSLGLLKTNPASDREEDLNPGPPDYKSSALTTRPRCTQNWHKRQRTKFWSQQLHVLTKMGSSREWTNGTPD